MSDDQQRWLVHYGLLLALTFCHLQGNKKYIGLAWTPLGFYIVAPVIMIDGSVI